MARKRIVAGNWKMNMTIEEGRNWLRSFSRHHDLAQLVEEVIIFPPFTALAALANDEQGIYCNGAVRTCMRQGPVRTPGRYPDR